MSGRFQRGARPGSVPGALGIAAAILAAVLCLVASPKAAHAAVPGLDDLEIAATAAVLESALVLASCPDEDAVSGLPLEPMCEVVAIDPDEDGFFASAPICDPSGASAVAPPPIHPIGNDRMEATPSCGDLFGGSGLQADADHGGKAPTERTMTSVDPAVVPVADAPPRWAGMITDVDPGEILGPAEGIRRRLEHPPTAR